MGKSKTKYTKKIKYSSTKTWAEKNPKKKIINCPVSYDNEGNPQSAIHVLLGAIMKSGYVNEGPDYFKQECFYHPGVSCGSFWVEVSGLLDRNYMERKGIKVRNQSEVLGEQKRKSKNTIHRTL